MEFPFQINTAIKSTVNTMALQKVKHKPTQKAIDKFNALPYAKQKELVGHIVAFFSNGIAKSIESGESVTVPSLGTFAIKEGSVVYREMLDTIAVELGYSDFYDVPFVERLVIQTLTKARQKDVQLDLKVDARITKGLKNNSYRVIKFSNFTSKIIP